MRNRTSDRELVVYQDGLPYEDDVQIQTGPFTIEPKTDAQAPVTWMNPYHQNENVLKNASLMTSEQNTIKYTKEKIRESNVGSHLSRLEPTKDRTQENTMRQRRTAETLQSRNASAKATSQVRIAEIIMGESGTDDEVLAVAETLNGVPTEKLASILRIKERAVNHTARLAALTPEGTIPESGPKQLDPTKSDQYVKQIDVSPDRSVLDSLRKNDKIDPTASKKSRINKKAEVENDMDDDLEDDQDEDLELDDILDDDSDDSDDSDSPEESEEGQTIDLEEMDSDLESMLEFADGSSIMDESPEDNGGSSNTSDEVEEPEIEDEEDDIEDPGEGEDFVDEDEDDIDVESDDLSMDDMGDSEDDEDSVSDDSEDLTLDDMDDSEDEDEDSDDESSEDEPNTEIVPAMKNAGKNSKKKKQASKSKFMPDRRRSRTAASAGSRDEFSQVWNVPDITDLLD